MKILFTIPYKKNGGVYSFCNTIIEEFNNQDISIFKRGSKEKRTNKILIVLEQIANYFSFFFRLTFNKYDLIFINTSLSRNNSIRDGLYILIAMIFRKKVLLFIHGFKHKESIDFVLKVGYFLSDGIIVLAEEFRDHLKSIGYRKEIFVIRNPINKDFLNFISSNDIENRQKRVPSRILFLSRIEKNKGTMIAVKAFEKIIEKHSKISLYIAGDGSQLDEIKNYVSDKKINNIYFLGFVSGIDKINLYLKSDLFLFPSLNEGLPINVLEAMSSGLPIVTRPIGGIKDFFNNKKMGFALDDLNPEKFSELVINLLLSKEYFNICRYNYNYALENFTPNKISSELFSIMIKIVNKYD
tara:strand:- start:1279 stop:2343 length:1065 start_codon:yes stop_codon:yes gene_type:complete